ncbi:uncharacterized protein [Physcomitrium patens]|uniref:FAM86 N-terminal domain-containing protein n=1 Tax=Physcomitrium patens TaxID=3218 RepID=A0A7I4CZ13_PHYPA|nr:putative uncharacterized protein DDB_G0277003 isoform X1 [Physcomitrium patens]|eukprot:XP_024367176.1 putative uncharacterized protein DDB_G0277003 isoform X1 [Physcomitrella patens]
MDFSDRVDKVLLAAFRAMEPPSRIISLARRFGGGVLSSDAQTFFLEKCLHDETCNRYPPGLLYLRRVLKQMILAAEKDGDEVLDGLYDLHAVYLLPPKEGSAELAPKCYKSFTYNIPAKTRAYLACKTGSKKFMEEVEHLVTLRVSLNMLEGDTGCSDWPAGLLLSEFVLSHPELFFGQKCLEIGAGAGMIGVLLSRLGASKVLLTDGSLATLANMKHNLSINNIPVEGMKEVNDSQQYTNPSTRVECRQLIWETLCDKELHDLESNIILGADLIYDPSYIPHLVRVLASLLSLDHPATISQLERSVYEYPVAYIATAIRNPDTLVFFVEEVKKAGLRMIEVSESMRPAPCLGNIAALNRATILIHKLQAWSD